MAFFLPYLKGDMIINMDLDRLYQEVIEKGKESEGYFDLPYSLSPEEVIALYRAHPELVLTHKIHIDSYFHCLNIFPSYRAPFLKDWETKTFDFVDGYDEALAYIRERRKNKIEEGFGFFAKNLDINALGFSLDYEMSDELARRSIIQVEGYQAFLTPRGAVLPVPLGGVESTFYFFQVENDYTEPIEEIEYKAKQVDRELNRIAAMIYDDDMPEAVKAFNAYNQIGSRAKYCDIKKYGDVLDDIPLTYHGPFACLFSGECVCDGFSKALTMLLRKGGIQSLIQLGEYVETPDYPHCWNLIQVEGTYYQADITWDRYDDFINHFYFLRSDAMVEKIKHWEKRQYPHCPKEKDFSPEIEAYLSSHRNELIKRGIDANLLDYDYADIKAKYFDGFYRGKPPKEE